MTKHLRISDTLSLPLATAVAQKFAWLGRTGAGKTYGAMKLAELFLEHGVQIIAIDPVGVWSGLRLGKETFSIPVFGGMRGDLPLEPTAGALFADLVVDRNISAVLDVSQMIDAEQVRFVAAFGVQFFQRKKARPSAVHVFLEEAQEFIPQDPAGAERMLNAWNRVIKIGRNFGIGVSIITQRPQEVSKKALNQTECMFAFQMTGTHERRAIAAWASTKGLAEELVNQLPRLAVGRAHVWSPQWLDVAKVVQIAEKRSADVSSTPVAGARSRAAQELSPIDLDAIRTAMAATIERAKAEDPKALRAELKNERERNAYLDKRVAELERAPAKTKTETRDVPALSAKDRAVLERLAKQLDAHAERLHATNAMAAGIVAQVNLKVDAARKLAADLRNTLAPPAPAFTPPSRPAAPSPAYFLNEQHTTHISRNDARREREAALVASGPGDTGLGNGGQRRILIALAQRNGLTDGQLGTRAGISSKGGSFSTYLSRSRSKGWLVDRDGKRWITAEGIAALGHYDPLPTGADLLEYWLNDLGKGGEAKILRVLAAAYPNALSNEEIGERAGLSIEGGSFSTYLSRLKTKELIVRERGQATASAELFD